MSNKTAEDKLFAILQSMIRDHETLFDEGTAQYIIGRLTTKKLMAPFAINDKIKNFQLNTNLFGYVLLKNSYRVEDDDKSNVAEWAKLLNEKDPVLAESPNIVFRPTTHADQIPKVSKEKAPLIKADFATYYSIAHFDNWVKLQEKEYFGTKFSDINKAVFTLEYLCNEQYCGFYYHKPEDKQEIAKKIFDIILEGKKEIIANKWHDETSFTNKLFASKNMRKVMACLSSETLEPLFTLDSLGAIIKQSNSHENIKDNVGLLGNLLALAPAEKWLEAWQKSQKTKPKEFNIVDLFNNKFFRAYGINIIETNGTKPGMKKETKSENAKGKAALTDELEFFLPAISKMNVNQESLCHFFNSVMRSRDGELMKLCLKHFDIPGLTPNSSEGFNKAYDMMIKKFDAKDGGIVYEASPANIRTNSWSEWFKLHQADELNNSLTVKEEVPKKRSLKL